MLGMMRRALPVYDNCPISLRAYIDGCVWHLDIDSSHPGAAAVPKGIAVRPLLLKIDQLYH